MVVRARGKTGSGSHFDAQIVLLTSSGENAILKGTGRVEEHHYAKVVG